MSYAIDQTDNEFAAEVGRIIAADLSERFPEGLPEEIAVRVEGAMLNAFFNGARFAEESIRNDDQAVKQQLVLLNEGAAPEMRLTVGL